MYLIFVGLILVLGELAASEEPRVECCDAEIGCFTNEHPYGHLPLPKCPDRIPPKFRLYTSQNPRNEEFMTRDFIPSQFNPQLRTIFLVHGWQGGGRDSWMNKSRQRLLERADYNVVQVGWSRGAGELWYPQSAANTRSIAGELKIIAERLVATTGTNPSLFWCVGFSLGAHLCGMTGMQTTLGRVTGLDPAGPEFESYDIMAGVNPTSAPFVDIIHTDGRSLIIAYGTLRPLGHYDFYPNRGHGQPGCITYYIYEEDEEKVQQGNVFSCSHGRAPEYWMESILNDCFISREICSDSRNIPSSCVACAGGEPCAYMGYAAERTTTGPGLYYLETGNGWWWSDFCKG